MDYTCILPLLRASPPPVYLIKMRLVSVHRFIPLNRLWFFFLLRPFQRYSYPSSFCFHRSSFHLLLPSSWSKCADPLLQYLHNFLPPSICHQIKSLFRFPEIPIVYPPAVDSIWYRHQWEKKTSEQGCHTRSHRKALKSIFSGCACTQWWRIVGKTKETSNPWSKFGKKEPHR